MHGVSLHAPDRIRKTVAPVRGWRAWQAPLALVLATMCLPAQDAAHDSDASRRIAKQANDPTTPITQIVIRPVYAPRLPMAGSGGSVFEVNPAIPFNVKGIDHLVKLSIPVIGVSPEPERAVGFGDVQIFDLLGFRSSFGSWGVGGTFVAPSATSEFLGEGKWQAGPAVGVIVSKVPHLLAGFVAQNPISFAGNCDRADVNGMSISPTLTYNFPKGWFLGHSDLDMQFNWRDGDDRLIPVGIQAGRAIRVGTKGLSISVEAAYSVVHPTRKAYPRWLFAFELVVLIPR